MIFVWEGGGWGYDDTVGIFFGGGGGASQNWTIFGSYF